MWTSLTDEQIFNSFFDIPKELEKRLIKVLKEKEINFYFLKDEDLEVEMFYKMEINWFKVQAVGYLNDQEGEFIFIIDKDDRIHYYDDIEMGSSWDLYKTIRDELKKE